MSLVTTIPTEEYEKMIGRLRWLDCLEMAGVDNWDGIEMAYEIFEGEEED